MTDPDAQIILSFAADINLSSSNSTVPLTAPQEPLNKTKMYSTTSQALFRLPEGIVCYVEIPATNIQACKNFYSAIFPSWISLRPALSGASKAILASLMGAIIQAPAGHQNEINQMIQIAGEAMVATISQCEGSIDEIKQRIEQHGGEARSEKERGVDGCYYMLFKDLDGNWFSIYEKN
ncbi:hypothetical protein N431DRAFT_478792 [Stipitochalara longipes BDJ]|nr:hypothetical protein N431DRAFT_478792 [Stipitochalara longipes BDJ]